MLINTAVHDIIKMRQDYGKIVVVMGGDSSEREISLMSGNAVYDALLKNNIEVYKFDYKVDSLINLISNNYSAAILMLHGKDGEDGVIQGFLECFNIPYSGSGILASSLAMDKYRTKLLWNGLSIPNARFLYIDNNMHFVENPTKIFNALIQNNLTYPLIVKPNHGGSTLGISIVNNDSELIEAINKSLGNDDAILIEEFLIGDEYTVVLDKNNIYPTINIKLPKDKLNYDYNDKYFTNNAIYECPAHLGELQDHLLQYARTIYESMGISGIARIDFMIIKNHHNQNNAIRFLEINTIPGMTTHSFVPMAFSKVGITFEQLCMYILNLSFHK